MRPRYPRAQPAINKLMCCAVQSVGIGFEIIFASWDKTKEEFDEYYGKMPWCVSVA